MRCFFLLAFGLVLRIFTLSAAEPSNASAALRAADAALKAGKHAEAIQLASQIIATNSQNDRAFFLRGRAYESAHDYPKALVDYNAGIKLNPKVPFAYQSRGTVYFRLGKFAESVADFDKFLEANPEQAPHHWQRGISLYYAGKFEEGRKQFEQHQTVNPYDVENAVWHFLCVARASGLEQARAALIPIERDARIPMMQIHSLFAGKAKAEEVMTAAEAGKPAPAELDNRLFYAHLYLGLYYEAAGNAKLAREHILKAATGYKADHYMGDVARIHAQLLKKSN